MKIDNISKLFDIIDGSGRKDHLYIHYYKDDMNVDATEIVQKLSSNKNHLENGKKLYFKYAKSGKIQEIIHKNEEFSCIEDVSQSVEMMLREIDEMSYGAD